MIYLHKFYITMISLKVTKSQRGGKYVCSKIFVWLYYLMHGYFLYFNW